MLALPSNATVLTSADRTRRSTRPFNDRLSGGSSAATPIEPPSTSGFSATDHVASAMVSIPFDNSRRDGRRCSTGMPENVNFAVSRTSAPSTAASVSSGSRARSARGEAADDAAGGDVAGDARHGELFTLERGVDRQRLHRMRPRPTQLNVPFFSDSVPTVPRRLPLDLQVERERPGAVERDRHAERLAETNRILEVAGELRAEVAVEARVPSARRAQASGADAHEQILQLDIVALAASRSAANSA